MTRRDEDTPVFKSIATRAHLRQESEAIAPGAYRTVYADPDILVFERRHQQDIVMLAVNRGDARALAIQTCVE